MLVYLLRGIGAVPLFSGLLEMCLHIPYPVGQPCGWIFSWNNVTLLSYLLNYIWVEDQVYHCNTLVIGAASIFFSHLVSQVDEHLHNICIRFFVILYFVFFHFDQFILWGKGQVCNQALSFFLSVYPQGEVRSPGSNIEGRNEDCNSVATGGRLPGIEMGTVKWYERQSWMVEALLLNYHISSPHLRPSFSHIMLFALHRLGLSLVARDKGDFQ